HDQLGIDGLDTLEAAANEGRIAKLPGFGARTEARIRDGIAFARSTRQRRRYPEALEVAARLVEWLRDLPNVIDAQIAGALRRRVEVVDQIELVAVADDVQPVISAFRALDGAGDQQVPGDAEVTIRLSDG